MSSEVVFQNFFLENCVISFVFLAEALGDLNKMRLMANIFSGDR
jgi:hypothetical protein